VSETFSVGDHVQWHDGDDIPRRGIVQAVLSVQLLVTCDDGIERFVFLKEHTLEAKP
jgi:hypothetical protein